MSKTRSEYIPALSLKPSQSVSARFRRLPLSAHRDAERPLSYARQRIFPPLICVILGSKDIASVMKSSVRKTDMVARYGGEELIIVFPELDKAPAIKVAEKIRSTVASHVFTLSNSEPSPLASISIGLAVFPEDGNTTNAIVKKADVMLYKAKTEGKNRVMA